MPQVRRQGPVRRQLRELRRSLCPDGTQKPLLGPQRRDAAVAPLGALFLQAVRSALRGIPGAVDAGQRPPADRGLQQDQGVAAADRERRRRGRPRNGRLGHQPRRALLRHRDSRCAGQVLLRLAGRADRLPGLAEEPLWQDRPGLRSLHGRPGHRAVPLHRQGHRHLPHAVLAGSAALQRPQDAQFGVRARFSDHQCAKR
jgi:hypothetical protein